MSHIRFIPFFIDGSQNLRGIFYREGNVYDIVHDPEKYDLNLSAELHYRLDLFEKIDKKWYSKDLQNLIVLDFDQEGPKEDRKIVTQQDIHTLQKSLSGILGGGKLPVNWTGFGLHYYLFFDEYFNPLKNPWLKVFVKELANKLNHPYLKLDPFSVNTHKAMRFPGSFYKKKGLGTEGITRFFSGDKDLRFKFKDFKTFWEGQSQKSLIIKQPNEDLKTLHLKKQPDFNAILGPPGEEWSGCRFLRWAFTNQADQNYPEWLAQLSLVSRAHPDRALAYDYAKAFSYKYPQFNEDEFKVKFNEVLDNMSPASCDHIEGIWRYSSDKEKGCVTCPHRKLNMPLSISFYPHKSTGWRIHKKSKSGQYVAGKIDYVSFTKWLSKVEKMKSCEDESLWKYDKDGGFYKNINEKLFKYTYAPMFVPSLSTQESRDIVTQFHLYENFNFEKQEEILTNKVVFKNGILDLKTGKLLDRKKVKVINNYALNFDYNPKADCPLYKSLIDWAFTDTAERDYFFKYIVKGLFLGQQIPKALVLCGSGSNGKSSLFNAIGNMFCEESRIITDIDFDSLKNDETYKSYLNYSKIGYCSDVSSRFLKNNEELLKRIISGERMSYRLKFAKSTIQFKNKCKIVVGMNEHPLISDSSYGMWRRFSFLNFKNTWPDDLRDDLFDEKLKAEGAGLFNFLYDYCLEVMKDPALPKLSDDTYQHALALANDWKAFADERLKVVDSNIFVTNTYLYEKFREYCVEGGVPLNFILTKRTFIHKLGRFYGKQIQKTRRNDGRGFLNLEVLTDESQKSKEFNTYQPDWITEGGGKMTELEKKLRDMKGKTRYIETCLGRDADYSWNPSRGAVLKQEMIELRMIIGSLSFEDQIGVFKHGIEKLLNNINRT